MATSTSKTKTSPRSTSEVSQETIPRAASSTATMIDIPLAVLTRHPANRNPTPQAITTILDSFGQHGQIEPILVRPLDGGGERYQVLSGETRWLAMARTSARTIRAIVEQYSDAEALRIVAAANAKRTDLNPIERAQLLAQMTRPVTEGGAGLTQEVAAGDVGLSRSAVSNSLRLLKLPKDVAALVAQGQVPETFIREILPLFDTVAKTLAGDAVRLVLKDQKDDVEDMTREDFVREVYNNIDEASRPLTPADKYERTNAWAIKEELRVRDKRTYHRSQWCYFDPKPHRDELGVFSYTNPWNKKTEERCINVKLFDQLQKEAATALLEKLESKAKSSAKQEATRELTPKERAQQSAEKTRAKNEKLAEWLHNLKRMALSQFLTRSPADPVSDIVRASINLFLASHNVFGTNERRKEAWKRLGIPAAKQTWDAGDWVEHALDAKKVVEASHLLVNLVLWNGNADFEFATPSRLPPGIIDRLFVLALNNDFRDVWNGLCGGDAATRAVFLSKLIRIARAHAVAAACGVPSVFDMDKANVVADRILNAKSLKFPASLFPATKTNAAKSRGKL